MKKALFFTVLGVLFLVGCSKSDLEQERKNFAQEFNGSSFKSEYSYVNNRKDAYKKDVEKASRQLDKIARKNLDKWRKGKLLPGNPFDFKPAPPQDSIPPIEILLTEEECGEVLDMLYTPSKDYLNEDWDIDVLEYVDEGDPRVVAIGVVALRIEELLSQNMYIDTLSFEESFLRNPFETITNNSNCVPGIHVDEDPHWYECLLYALGVDVVVDVFNNYVSEGAKRLIAKKAVRKAAVRIIGTVTGGVGTIVAVYFFGECMGWYEPLI